MDKYSEEKEGNQWDDDFIFDSVPLPVRKRGTSTSTAITSHLSTSSSAVQKDKRKSNSTWNNAFKKIEADPRHTRTTSSVSSGKSSAVSTSSNTKNIIQSQSSTPHSIGGGEFAFFDSDDCVGFGKAAGSRLSPWPSSGSQTGSGVSQLPPRNRVSNGLPPTPPPATTSHLTKQSSGRTQDTADDMEFDDGLGEGNLGFNDDDYIPNVGFDDFDDFPTPSRSQPSSSLSQSTPSWSQPSQPVQHSTTASMSSNLSSSVRNSSSDSGSRVHPAPYGMQLHSSGGPYRLSVPPMRLNSTSSDLLASSSSVVGEQLLEEILENDEPLSFDVVGTLANASAGDTISLVGSTAGLRNPHAYTHDGSVSGSNYIGVPQLHRSSSGTSSMMGSRDLGQRPPSNPLTAARISSYGYLAALSLSDDSPLTGISVGTTPAGSAIRALSTTTPAGSSVNSPFRSSLRSPGAYSEGGVEPSPTVSVKERIMQYERREYINESPASEDSDTSDSIKTTEKRVSNNTALTGVGTSGSHGHHRHEDNECSDDSYTSSYSRSHSGQYSSRSYSSYDHSHSGSGSHTDSISGSGSDFDSVSEFDSQDSAELTESKEDIEEGDWDLDLEPPTKASALHSAQTFKDIITGRVGGTQGAVNTAEEDVPETERESLLDFLKSTVQRTIIPTPKSQLGSPAEMEAAARELLERSYDSADGDGAGVPLGARVDVSMGRSSAHSVSTPSLSSRDYNMEAYEEEGHNVETANPHLRGLLSWVDATTQCFNTVLTTANSSTTHNARTLLHTEVDLPGGDELYMEKLLERCEQLPSSSSSIPTLEIVSKWLRAICNLYDKIIGSLHYSSSNEQEHCDSDMRSSSHSTSAPPKVRRTASLGEAKFNQFSHTQTNNEGNNKNDSIFFGELSGRRIAHIYDYCDSILQEQLFSTTTALGTNYRKLLSTHTTSSTTKNSTYNKDRNSTYNKDRNSTYNKDRNSTYNTDRNSMDRNSTYNTDHTSDTEWCTQNNTTTTTKKDIWLVNMGMVAVKDPVHYDNSNTQLRCVSAPSDDDMLITDTIRLSSNLISLYRLQINMLEIRIHMYDGFELVACLELLQKISEELEKVSNTLFAALRRALPVKERCTAEQIAQLIHLDELNTVANDLLGCCFSIKVFAICCVSPINFQNLPEHCQHINQNGPEIAKVGTYDGSSYSEDGYPTLGIATATTATVAGNRTSTTKKITKTYNVIYELTLGTHFLEVMLTLSTPSVVRSKIYLGVFTYLQRLKKKQLPWQNRHFKLISLKQQLDSFANVFNLYQGADTFGLNYADMDNNSFTLSLAEVEGSIVQSFAEVFGSLDQHRIEQLLLFESANELLPSVAREETKGPAAYLRRHPPAQSQDTQPVQSTEQPYNKDGDRGESDLSDLNHRSSSSKQPWGVFTSMRSAFRHLSVALNLDTSLTWGKRRSESSHTGGTTTSTTTSTTHHLYLLNNAPTRPKLKGGLSYNARYELFYFSNHVLYRLAQAIIEMSPNIALDVLQLCILLLGHLRHPKERARVEKIAVMLAVKVGRRDAAIWHGEAVLRNLQLQGDNVNEMLYMTDLLAAQYSENAQYELAAKALFSAISALNNRNKGGSSLQSGSPIQSQRRNHNSTSSKDRTRSMSSLTPDDSAAVMEFERTLDPLLLKLGKLLLHFGCPDRAADTFQVLLSSLCERTDCLANDAKKVTVLSWLAEAYLELEDYNTCSSVIKAIKAVRSLKLHKVTRAVRLERASKRIIGRDTTTTTGSIKLSRKSSKSKSLTPPISLSRTLSDKGLFNRNNSKHFFADHSPSSSSRNTAQQSTTSLPDPETPPPAPPPAVGVGGVRDTIAASADSVSAAVVPIVLQHRGIAVQSTDSFDFDTNNVDVLRENSTDKIPLYTTPKDNNNSSSRNMQDSDALRWRPLPVTPKNTAQIPPLWTPEVHLSSPSTTTGQRKSKLLRKRPPPLAPLDSLEQICMHSNDASIIEVKDSFEGIDNTPPVQNSEDYDTTPTPSSSSNVPVGLKRSLSKRKRKSRLLNNLQALHISNSNNNLNGVSPQNTSRSDSTKGNELGNTVSTGGGGGGGSTATPAHPLPPPTPFPNTITGSIASNRNSGIPAGAAAVSSIYLHYLRNPPEANLPQFCATVEDLDLGSLKARLHYKNKKYAEALKFLLPTLIGVELMVIGTSQRIVSKGGTKHETQQQPFWSRQALLELGDLYYLRGKIQLEAAKSCADVTYPLQVGSKDLFERVQSALAVSTPTTPSTTTAATCMSPRLNTTASDTPRAGTGLQYGTERRFCKYTRSKRTRRDGSTPVPTSAAAGASPNSFFKKDTHTDTMPTSDVLNMTCREPKLYETPADMCWDALQWFHRAKDVARIAGDEIGGALAANALASCHLLPAFASHALFKVPLDKALNLSSTTTATTTPPPTTTPSPSLIESKITAARASVGKKASLREVQQEGVGKKASLREVQHSMEWALEVHSQSCLPLPLMDAYMNLAEMCELLGNAADGLAFWAETKELFMHLFADGTLIPLVRRASAGFVRKLQSILNRIVRFMWTLDKVAVNSCLYLLDIQVLLQHEIQRMIHRNTIRAQCVSSWLPDVLVRILHPDGPADPVWEQQQHQQMQQRKRSTISRVSRFFTRLFVNPTMSAQPVLSNTHTREPLSASPRNSTNNHNNNKQSPVSNRLSGRYSNSSSSNSNRDRHSSSRQHTPDHHTHSPNTTSTVGGGGGNKGSNSFDGFIERSGFSTQLDMRRFYNIMNAELVAEKVFSFGWSHSVEYDQLLKPVLRDSSNNKNNSEVVEQYPSNGLKDRPSSISSIATTQPVFNSGKHSSRSAHSVNGVEALIVLNLRSKLDFAAKYRSILPATYLQEHLLTRSMFTTTDIDGEEEIDSVFGGSNKDYSPVPAAPVATLARSNSLLGLSPRSGRGIKRTPSSCLGEQSCDHLTSLTPSAVDVKSSGPSELPLDPFSDFDWMDESFADYTPHSRSLQARAVYDRQHSCAGTNTTSRSRYKRGMLGAESAQFPAMFMPEFDEAHAFSAQEVQNSQSKHHHRAESGSSGTVAWEQEDTQLSGGGGSTNPSALLSSEFTAEYLRSLDERAETILIQRVWRCYMLVQNARKGYRSGQRSMGLLRHDVRSALSSLCLNMVRLRAFSRQYQPSLLDFDKLQEDLSKLPASLTSQGHTSQIEKTVDINTEEQELLLRYQNGMLSAEEVHTLKKSFKERRRKQPVLLQHRLPFLVYTIHIEDCLLLYRPYDGSKAVQKLGGSGFLTLTGSYIQGSEQIDTATVSSAPHSTTTATPPPPPLGIAEKSKHETHKLEQKSSLFSMLSFMSGGSDVTRDSSLQSHTQTGKQSKMEGNSFFFRSSSWLVGSSPRTPSSGGVFFSSDQSSSDMSCAALQDPHSAERVSPRDIHNNSNNTTTTAAAGVNVRVRDALLESSDVSTNSAIGTASAEHSDLPTVSCAPPILRQCDTKLLFDLTVGVEDQQCGGGKEGRRTILTEMCAHVNALSPSLQFIQAVGESINKPRMLESDIQYGDKVTSSLNSSILGAAAIGKQPQVPSNAAIAALRGETEDTSIAPSSLIGLSSSMSNILGLFSSSDSVEATQQQWKQGMDEDEGAPHRAPCKQVPLTLICTPSVAVLPWESLLIKSKVCVVRQVGLIALCSQVLSSQHWLLQSHSDNPAPRKSITTANAVVGPRRHQKAALVAVDYSTTELSAVSVQSSCTRVATSCITALGHNTTHLHTGIDNADVGEGNTITSLQGQHTSRSPLACSLDARVLPLSSQLFNQSTRSSASFLGKSEILIAGSDMKLNDSHRPVQLHDFWKCLPVRPPPTLQRRGKSAVDITVLYGHFPLLILSYTDYVALSDAVAWVISSQPEAVMVFAPTFLHEPLCIELKLCLDRWCKPDISVSPPRSPVSQGSRSHAHSAGTGTRTESSITMPGAYGRSRSEGSSSVLMFSGFRSMGSSGSATERPESSEHTPHSRSGSRSTTGGFGTFLSKTAASLLPGRSNATTGSSQQQQLDTSFEATQLQQQHSTNSSRFGSGGMSTKSPPLPVIAEEKAKRSPTARSKDGGHGVYSTNSAVHQSHSSDDVETTEALHLTDRAHMSLDGNRGSTSQTAKALRGKERTWIYHAVMSVVQSMQEEHQVPIVVFA